MRNSSDGLLRWAEEVLRKAQECSKKEAPEQPSCGKPPVPLTPGAKARRRRADDLRDEVNRLTKESEREAERLASEEARRRRSQEPEDDWRKRLNAAADEFRSNLGRMSFGSHTSQAKPRSESVPSRYTSRRVSTARTPQWDRVESVLEQAGVLRFSDIPWPAAGNITGVTGDDSAGVAKRKLAAALRRWHPDKWRRILDHVIESDQKPVMERVKVVAQQLLDEKAKMTGPGGILH